MKDTTIDFGYDTLPALEGPAKQVAWAEKIRSEKVAHVRGVWTTLLAQASGEWYADRGQDGPGIPARIAEAQQRVAVEGPLLQRWLRDHAFGQTSAKWWIDNRTVNLLEEAHRSYRAEYRAALAGSL